MAKPIQTSVRLPCVSAQFFQPKATFVESCPRRNHFVRVADTSYFGLDILTPEQRDHSCACSRPDSLPRRRQTIWVTTKWSLPCQRPRAPKQKLSLKTPSSKTSMPECSRLTIWLEKADDENEHRRSFELRLSTAELRIDKDSGPWPECSFALPRAPNHD
jgi:hypothetical protein